MKHHLEITIPDHNKYYSLFAEGSLSWKTYDSKRKTTFLYYAPEAVVVLFYTYPSYREACVIRNSAGENNARYPGLSKNISVLFNVRASRVDKLKRAVNWLNNHTSGAFSFTDAFYIRLFFFLNQRGKINYPALSKLAENFSVHN